MVISTALVPLAALPLLQCRTLRAPDHGVRGRCFRLRLSRECVLPLAPMMLLRLVLLLLLLLLLSLQRLTLCVVLLKVPAATTRTARLTKSTARLSMRLCAMRAGLQQRQGA